MIAYQPMNKTMFNVFRMVCSGPRIKPEDLEFVLDEIERLGKDLSFFLVTQQNTILNLSVFYVHICVLGTWSIPFREQLFFAIDSEIEKQIFSNFYFQTLPRRNTFAAENK